MKERLFGHFWRKYIDNPVIITTVVQLSFGFLAAFTAILSWSKTRESAWLFIISGTLMHYISLLYQTLTTLGVLNPQLWPVGGIPLLALVLQVMPFLMYTIGFILFLLKKRKFS